MPVTDNKVETVVLEKVSYIHYPVWFQEDQEQVKALLNSGSKVNAMNPTYAKRLGIKTRKINVGAQKIYGSILETFEIVIADFQIEDKGGRSRFFQETFLVADIKFEMILEMPFLKLSNADISFGKRTLTWKSYITNETLLTTKRVQLVNPKKIFIAALDANSETFVMHVTIQGREEKIMDLDRKA